jgi:F0F1-type ATP synthase assembly protein I
MDRGALAPIDAARALAYIEAHSVFAARATAEDFVGAVVPGYDVLEEHLRLRLSESMDTDRDDLLRAAFDPLAEPPGALVDPDASRAVQRSVWDLVQGAFLLFTSSPPVADTKVAAGEALLFGQIIERLAGPLSEETIATLEQTPTPPRLTRGGHAVSSLMIAAALLGIVIGLLRGAYVYVLPLVVIVFTARPLLETLGFGFGERRRVRRAAIQLTLTAAGFTTWFYVGRRIEDWTYHHILYALLILLPTSLVVLTLLNVTLGPEHRLTNFVRDLLPLHIEIGEDKGDTRPKFEPPSIQSEGFSAVRAALERSEPHAAIENAFDALDQSLRDLTGAAGLRSTRLIDRAFRPTKAGRPLPASASLTLAQQNAQWQLARGAYLYYDLSRPAPSELLQIESLMAIATLYRWVTAGLSQQC